MIISASRRTDIPAFYSEWFLNRISEGFLCVRNPMNIHQVSKINLDPELVDCIVFWSKNPKNIIDKLDYLRDYNYYFQYTITGYGKLYESEVPETEESIKLFCELSNKIGKNRVIWRYDPIIISEKLNMEYHEKIFSDIARKLQYSTERCVISFVDRYRKTIRNTVPINILDVTSQQMIKIASRLSAIAAKHFIQIVSCAEFVDLDGAGIKHGKCIDDKLIEEISGFKLNIAKDKSQRKECGCMASIDIGAYNTCPHGCLYCYANSDCKLVQENYALHDPCSPLLFGELNSNDILIDRKVVSCKVLQQNLF